MATGNYCGYGRLFKFALCAAILSSCTTRAEIDYVKTHTEWVGGSFSTISTVDSLENDNIFVGSDQFLVELSSSFDLSKVVREKEMAFLYYRIRNCGAKHGDQDLIRDSVLISEQKDERVRYHYFAPIEWDYVSAIERRRAVFHLEPEKYSQTVCISLGAGNMAGQVLETNRVSFTLPVQ